MWSARSFTVHPGQSVGDLTTPRNISRPTTELRSGGPRSLIPWDSMGREGRIFVGEGPDEAQ